MRAGILLVGLLLMIVFSDLVSSFLWRVRELSPESMESINERRRAMQTFRKPSEVYRQMYKQTHGEDGAPVREEDRKNFNKNVQPEGGLTFQEFTSIRQKLRNQRRHSRYPSVYEEENNQWDDNGQKKEASEGSCKEGNVMLKDAAGNVQCQKPANKDKTELELLKDIYEKMEAKRSQKDAPKAASDRNIKADSSNREATKADSSDRAAKTADLSVADTEKADVSASTHDDLPENDAAKSDSDKVQFEKSEDGVSETAAREILQKGDSLRGKVQSHRTQRDGQSEKAGTSEKPLDNTDETCEQCFSIRYHALTAIVCAVWVTNIVFIAWVFLGRQGRNARNMRIPTTFAGTSPPSSAHRKPTPPSLDNNLEKGSLQSTQARSKPPTSLPKGHKQSVSLTAIPSHRSQDRHDLSADPQLASLNEARKKRYSATDPASFSYKTSAPIVNQRTHNHKLQQNNLSPISENSNEDSVYLKEQERTQSKLVDDGEKGRRTEGSAKHYLPPGEGNPPLRRNAPEVESLGRDTSAEPIRGVQIYDDPQDESNMEEIPGLCKSLPRNEGQGEPCVGATEISMGSKHERGETVNGSQTKKASNVDEELLSSLSQDLPTQVSSKEANQTSVSRSTTHMVTASSKYPSNFGPGNSKSGDPGERHRYMAQVSLKEKILLDTKNNRKSRLMQTKTGGHNGLDAKGSEPTSTREGGHDKLAADAPRYDSENSRSRCHGRDTKQNAAHDSDVSDDCLDTNCDSKGYVEQKSSKLHSAALLEDGTMAPPPLGYHVRKDTSNPESSNPGQSKKAKRACPNDVNVFRKHKTGDAHLPPNLASSGESVSYSGKGDMWKILYPKHKDKENPNQRPEYTNDGSGLVKDGHSQRHEYCNDGSGTAKGKHSRKLLIIGKLNCFLDTHKRKGKHGTKTQLVLKRGNRHAICDGSRVLDGDGSQESLRISRAYTRALEASAEQVLMSGETIQLLDQPKSTKVSDASLHLRSLEGIKGYSKGSSHKGKHVPGVYIKKSARQQSVFKLSNGVCLKRLDVKRHSLEDQTLRKRSHQISASQSILKLAIENRKHSLLKQSDRHKHGDVYRKSELMSSRHMNANSNAGVFEPCAEDTADGKPDIRQSMGSSLSPNSKQCYSIRTDTEGNVFMANDPEARQPRFLSQEVDQSAAAHPQQPAECLIASTGSDRIKNFPQGKEYLTQLDSHGRHATSEKHSNKNVVQTYSEKAVNLKTDKTTSRSQTALKATTSDYAAMAASNYKRKHKSKIPEASSSKLENTSSMKTSSTTSVKAGMRTIASRHKLEPQKQPPITGDVQKAVLTAMEKSSKNYVDNVRLTRFIKNNEGQQEGAETKLRQRPSYETNIGRAPWKELYIQDRPWQRAQAVRSTESDHRHSPLKIPDYSYKSQDGITKLSSYPKTMPHQSCYKKNCLSLNNPVYTSGVNDIKHISEVNHLAAINSRRLSTSPKIAGEPCNLPLRKDNSNKTDLREMEEILKTHCILSPQFEFSSPLEKELFISPNDKLNNSPKIKSIHQEVKVKRELPEDDQFEGSDQTSVTLNQPPYLTFPENAESMNIDMSLISKCFRVKKCSSSLSEGSAPTNALCYANMHISRKMESQKCEASEDVREIVPPQSLVPTRKKKSQQRFKPQSKSPDGKKKKRVIKKSSNDGETSKPEKIKKLKTLDKLPEKKKKKKKMKQKSSENIGDNSEPQVDKSKSCQVKNVSAENGHHQTVTNNLRHLRNEVNDSSQSQDLLCPVVDLMGDNTQTPEPSLAPSPSSLKDEASLPAPLTNPHRPHERAAHSLDRLHVRAPNETNYATASAENISTPSDPVLEEPSQASPLAVTDPTSAVVVQVSTCPRVKRVERNLQAAELGWNSSTFSSDEKAALEKGRLTQKRAKLRYYIVKTKPRKSDAEVTSKLKRPSTRLSLADDDVIKCGSEADISGDVIPQERSRTSQGKSVQFSDNIQDLEELKPELAPDLLPQQRSDDSPVHHASTKIAAEILKTSCKLAVDAEPIPAGKLGGMRKADLRSPITSPKRRRPVWSKKSSKHAHAGTEKTESTAKPVSQHHSSENVSKPSSRFNIHVYYPVKQGSPKLVNMSPGDKRKVSYNTWISSMCLAAPLDKTFKKLVAKNGSPVDIREIIEGSSVDGMDHFKLKKSSQEGNMRATRSASHVGVHRGFNSRKRDKATEDVGSTQHKRSRNIKVRENWSPQTRSVNDAKEDPVNTVKVGPVGSDGTNSQDWSTDIDNVVLPKRKVRYRKFDEHGHCLTKGHKLGKKQRSATKWQIAAAEEAARNTADLEQVRYSGDMMELNVINMGLTWVVQKVVNKLRFLKPKATLSDPSVVLSSSVHDPTTEIASNN